jgi:8-oxo-dGTP diphosphatase
MSQQIDPEDFPLLFTETDESWANMTVRFELGSVPEELISNVVICPRIREEWVIIRIEDGWSIPGGTLEPDEHYLSALERELEEEAGAQLRSDFQILGGFRMDIRTDKPYRPHLPFPVAYRLVGVGEVELTGAPSNPPDGEQVLEVTSFRFEEAYARLHEREPAIAELYRLAAAVTSQT